MTPDEEQEWGRRVKSGEMLQGHEPQWATAHVSPGAIGGEHRDCGGEIVVTYPTLAGPMSTATIAKCEKCNKRYRLTLKAELEAIA